MIHIAATEPNAKPRPPRSSRKNAVAELAKPRAPWKNHETTAPARPALRSPATRLPPMARIRRFQTYAKLNRKSLTMIRRHNLAADSYVNI
jgi:hypothetical protein